MTTPDTEWEKELKKFRLNYPVTTGYGATDVVFNMEDVIKKFIQELLSSHTTYLKERVRKEVEDMSHNIKIEIAGISGILNGSAVSDSGQAHTAQMKLGNILEALDTLLDNMK